MFDLGFAELLVIGVVALIVIGPERLPKVARTFGHWLGRLNRFVSDVKQDIDRDLKLEELRKLQAEMRETAQKYEILAEEVGQGVREEAGQIERVVQAMAATDGGLARREFEKVKSGTAGIQSTGLEGAPSAPTDPGTSPSPGGALAPQPSAMAAGPAPDGGRDVPSPLNPRPAGGATPVTAPDKGA